jgi:hypothetical protein
MNARTETWTAFMLGHAAARGLSAEAIEDEAVAWQADPSQRDAMMEAALDGIDRLDAAEEAAGVLAPAPPPTADEQAAMERHRAAAAEVAALDPAGAMRSDQDTPRQIAAESLAMDALHPGARTWLDAAGPEVLAAFNAGVAAGRRAAR